MLKVKVNSNIREIQLKCQWVDYILSFPSTCFYNTVYFLQGFLIFILHCVLNEEVSIVKEYTVHHQGENLLSPFLQCIQRHIIS